MFEFINNIYIIKILMFLKRRFKKEKYSASRYLSKKQLPTSFRIDASTICQLKCHSCYMNKTENIKTGCSRGFLQFEDYKKFVDNNVVTAVELSNNGEIFLNPDLYKIIEYSYKKNVKLTAYNGVNFNNVPDKILEALVKYKFNYICFSIDGASQETYSKYRIGGDFNKVISNIKRLNYYKEKYNSNYPILMWKFILFGHTEHEIPKAKKMAKELNMKIKYAFNWDLEYSPIKDWQFVEKETGISKTTNEMNLKKLLTEKKEHYACLQMWEDPQINWDGRLLGCCWNYDKDYDVNVFKVGLKKALNASNFRYAKKMLIDKAKDKKEIPCSNCTIYKIMRENNLYINK